jgi:hypothetical protein
MIPITEEIRSLGRAGRGYRKTETMPKRSLPIIFFAFANDKQEGGRYLRNLTLERNKLKEALKKAVLEELCEIVVEPDATIDTILNTFQDERYRDRIAIFHYGGHADGYQLMLETQAGGHEIAHGAGLVSFLARQKGLQLIFLNGCSTQKQSKELVEKGVPLVIGTSNSIPDGQATQLATRFYRGLGEGHSLERAWKEAEDEAQIRAGDTVHRGFSNLEAEMETDHFPWHWYLSPGAEPVKAWNLPDAGENPLFGLDLPDDPYYLHLPQAPYRGLKRFEQRHAALFFGRGREIRALYDKIQGLHPVILYFGQSGVGKSSLLAAGLQPRIEDRYQVRYVRREQEKGLLGSLMAGLDHIEAEAEGPTVDPKQKLAEIEQLQAELNRFSEVRRTPYLQRIMDQALRSLHQYKEQMASMPGLLQQWRQIESREENKPLLLILDQVEEAFTKPMAGLTAEAELNQLMAQVQEVFGHADLKPAGKLILAFRKEYQAEVEKALESHRLPFTKVFLTPLDEGSIREAVRGVALDKRLQEHYGIKIAPKLPAEIARHLSQDQGGTIAPVLQILMRKLWEAVEEKEQKVFDLKLFAQFEKSMGLQDFLEEKIALVRELEAAADPESPFHDQELVDSGFLLDLLYQLVSEEGTAIHLGLEELNEWYSHREKVLNPLIDILKKENLLLELKSEKGPVIRLTHDTLARLIKQNYEASEYPGQRSSRILQSKLRSKVKLSEDELKIVDAGNKGRKGFTEAEKALIRDSREQHAVENLLEKAEELMNTDPVQSYRYAYHAWKELGQEKGMGIMNRLAQRIATARAKDSIEIDYTTIGITGNYASGYFTPAGNGILLGGRLDVWLYNLKGELIYSLKKELSPRSLDFQAVFHPAGWDILVSESKRLLLGHSGGLSELAVFRSTVFNASFSPSGDKILVPTEGEGGFVYDLEGLQLAEKPQYLPHVGRPKGRRAYPHAIFSPDEKFVVSNSQKHEHELVVWSLEQEKIVKRLKGHTAEIHSFCFSWDGKWLISPSFDGTVRFWQWSPGKKGHGQCLSVLDLDQGKTGKAQTLIVKAAIHPNKRLLAFNIMTNGNSDLLLYRLESGGDFDYQFYRKLNQDPLGSNLESLTFSPDGRYLLEAAFQGEAKLWDLAAYWADECKKFQQTAELNRHFSA